MKTSLRKYLSLVMVLCVAFVCLFAGVSVKAADAVYKSVYFDATTMEKKISSYTATWNTTVDGDVWSIANANNNNLGWSYIRMGRKGNASVGSISTTFAMDKAITKVVVTIDSVTTANINSLKVYVASDSAFSNVLETVTATAKTGEVTFAIANPVANAYYKFEADCSSASKNGIIQISRVDYYAETAAPMITVSGDAYAEVEDVVKLTATASNISGTVTWASSNTSVATVDQNGNVTAKAMGTTTITASINDTIGEFKFNVFPTDGSELTIAEALQVCELTGETNCAFIYSTTGVIASIDTAYDSGYGNITVTISDETGSIKAFRMTGGAELNVGDEITVTGTLINYSGNTPEFIQGCTYEVVKTNDSIVVIKEALKDVAAYMSLGFKYTSTTTTKVVAATEAVVAKYAGGETTNMVEGANDPTILGLDSTLFDVTVDKGAASSIIGLNTNGSIRLYANKADGDGNELTIATKNDAIIQSITVVFSDQQGAFTVNGVEGSAEVTEYSVNSTSVTIKNISTASSGNQTRFESITLNVETEGEGTESVEVTTYSDVDFRIRCGVDYDLADIEGVDSYGIKVSAAGKEIYYNEETATSWDSDEDCLYVTIALGDILTTMSRSSVEFTVTAYVVVDGVTYESESSKTYSVAGLVSEYYNGTDETIKNAVASLYDLYDKEGLFE